MLAIRRSNLTSDKVAKLSKTIKVEGPWELEGDANIMWDVMVQCVRDSAKEVLGF